MKKSLIIISTLLVLLIGFNIYQFLENKQNFNETKNNDIGLKLKLDSLEKRLKDVEYPKKNKLSDRLYKIENDIEDLDRRVSEMENFLERY